MSEDKLTYSDVKDYEKFFTLTPPFLLERFAKKSTNIVLKFKPKVESYINRLNENQKNKLDILLSSDIDELQDLMVDAYNKTKKKQYKILANPKYKQFIKVNLEEVEKMIK